MSYNAKVYRTQGATAMVVASGGQIQIEAGGGIAGLGLSGALPGNLASGTIPLGANLFSARKLASAENYATGAIHITTTGNPSLEQESTVSQTAYLEWASAQVVGIKLAPIAMPVDLSTAGGLTVELFGETAGTATAADAAQGFDIRCWAGVGDTEMGATHPNFTTTPSWKGITLSSADLTTDTLNITLVPLAHAGRALRVFDARIRYTRTS